MGCCAIIVSASWCLPNIIRFPRKMFTLSVFAAGLLQRQQHVRRLGDDDPRATGVRLPVAVAAFHHRFDLVIEAGFQTLGRVLHPDVRPFHHLFRRQAPPGGRYERRHDGLAGVRRTTAAVRQHHHPGRLLPAARVTGGPDGTPLARRTRQRYGNQRFQLVHHGERRRSTAAFRDRFLWCGGDGTLLLLLLLLDRDGSGAVLFGDRPDVQR